MKQDSRIEEYELLIDAHIHLHEWFDENVFLESAVRNFDRWSARASNHTERIGFLMFSDARGTDSIGRLMTVSRDQLRPEWSFEETAESCSILARRYSRLALVLVAGRQIETAEGLEILALATSTPIQDGQPFLDTLRAIVATDAIPVIPWGFGKWSFRRGKFLMDFLNTLDLRNQFEDHEIFLGDNAGRTRWLGDPTIFQIARSKGIRFLPGSDPLPFAPHATRAGSFGFLLEGKLDLARPAASLKGMLSSSREQLRPFGQLERLPRFVFNQVAMQFRKRVPAIIK
jgi:hypothetical protein